MNAVKPTARIIDEDGHHYLIVGSECVFLGVNKSQADAKMKRILAMKPAKNQADAKMQRILALKPAKKNPKRKTASKKKPTTRRKARKNDVSGARRKVKANPKRKLARKTAKRKPAKRAAKRNPAGTYHLQYFTKAGKLVGRGESKGNIAGLYRTALKALNSVTGRSASAFVAKIHYGPRLVGTIDRDGGISMSNSLKLASVS